jgi:hypothetical protein
MTEQMEIAILINSSAFSFSAGLLIGFWHDIKDQKMPRISAAGGDKRQSKQNFYERMAFAFTCAILSGFVGAMIGLYYLGFMTDLTMPNAYGRAFISLGAGFLMPKIFEHTDSLSISKLIGKFFAK